jgi:exopolysaccharide biosynthesis polyprenyl glycosylphosphotransferase
MSTRRQLLLTLLKLCDLGVVAMAMLCAFVATADLATVQGALLDLRFSVRDILSLGGYLAAWYFVLQSNGVYRSYRLSRASKEIRDIGRSVVVATALLLPATLLTGEEALRPPLIVVFGVFEFSGLVCERRILRGIGRAARMFGHNLREIVIVGDPGAAAKTARALARHDGLGYRVVDVLEASDTTPPDAIVERLEATMDRHPIDEVFLALPLAAPPPLFDGIAAFCEEQGITVRVVANIAMFGWAWTAVDTLFGQPVVTIATGPPDNIRHGFLKRVIDMVGALAALLLLSPLLAVIAIAVKLDSPGPALFAQERVGLNRRRFRLYKFRTMVQDADRLQASVEALNEADGPVFKIKDDPRITRLGRWLRRTSLDELPQFFNVLLGDMSLVGPRPLPLRDVSRLDVRWHKRRFSVPPGITCLWQVMSRTPQFDDWIRSDMEYIDNWSLALDMKILAKTIPAVLSRQGAY